MTVLSLLTSGGSYLDVTSQRNGRGNEGESSATDLAEQRQFHFNIESDHNLQTIINNNLSVDTSDDTLSTSSIGMFGEPLPTDNSTELTSHYILSKLYNYMKISEMSKYGISVFEMTFSSYLSYLTECDLIKLATSYWCNGQHFKCMISHRGDVIRSHNTLDGDTTSVLRLQITNDLLDAAMDIGASVDKVEAMLLQKRIDDGVKIKKHKCNHSLFFNMRYERDFYLRNLKHRFWNHEVLLGVFSQNGWLTQDLAAVAMTSFVKCVYNRVLRSKVGFVKKHIDKSRDESLKLSQSFLRSFFVSYFGLKDIPNVYKHQMRSEYDGIHGDEFYVYQIREEVLTRWCALVELLASRGAKVHASVFQKIIPLQYALQLGQNTYKIIFSSHDLKNRELIPYSYLDQNIEIPNDIWDLTISYL